MDGASILNVLLVMWAAVTLVFGALLMWKYLVGMREDNMVILNAAEAGMAAEQQEITAKIERIAGWVKVSGVASLIFLMGVAAIFVHRAWIAFNGGAS